MSRAVADERRVHRAKPVAYTSVVSLWRLVLLVQAAAALGGCEARGRWRSPDVVEVPTVSTAGAPPPLAGSTPSTPIRVAAYEMGLCNLVATATRVYWLEIRHRARARGDGSAAAGTRAPTVALQCDEAGGALVRASRLGDEKITLLELDYRPFGLTAREGALYWTGAPCRGRARTQDDPAWLWSYRDGSSSGPTTIGERDRNYLGLVASASGVFVSDRFGKGGALLVDDAHPTGRPVLPDTEEPWLIAADERILTWTDRAWVLSRTELETGRTTKGAPLGAMPTDGAAFAGGLVVRTTEAVLVLDADGRAIRTRIAIPSYGDRGGGAFVGGRYYYWADGDEHLSRLDVVTLAVVRVHAPEAAQACGVAVHGNAIFWADRGRDAVFAWHTGAFDEAGRPPPFVP